MAKNVQTVIRPKPGLAPLDVAELWDFRDLLFFLVMRDIKVRYQQTLLGVLWVVLQPMFTVLLFSFIFGNLAHIPSDGVPYPLFAYSGLIIWNYFSSTLNNTANSLIANSNLISKIYFPRLIIPAGASLSGLIDLFISSAFFIILLLYFHTVPHSLFIIAAPVLLVMIFLLASGCGLWLSALNVEYRDFQHVVPFLVQLWMFATPLIYPTSLIPDRYRWAVYLNPVCGLVEAFRSFAIGTNPVNWTSLAFSLVITLVIVTTGSLYFRKVERSFADVI